MSRDRRRYGVEALEPRENPSTLNPLSAAWGPTLAQPTVQASEVHAAAARGHVSVRETVPRLFNAKLTGRAEVPPSPSRASGSAILLVDKAGTEIRYALDISTVNNIVSARLYLGTPGTTGPAVALLYQPKAPLMGGNHGRLAHGTLTAASLTGPLQGSTINDLAARIRAGTVYLSITTDDGVPPVEGTPGDLPGGEIRGQVLAVKG